MVWSSERCSGTMTRVRFVRLVRYDGGVSATALDMIYWNEMYPPGNRDDKPTLHLSVKGGKIWYKWQPTEGETEPGRPPPLTSPDRSLLDMLKQCSGLLRLKSALVPSTARLAARLSLLQAPR